MKKHELYYLLLACILFAGLFLTLRFNYDKKIQLIIIILTALLYVALGIIHHIRDHSISLKIMLEYIAIATLGIAISYFMIRIHV